MGSTNHFLFGNRLRDLKRNDRRGEQTDGLDDPLRRSTGQPLDEGQEAVVASEASRGAFTAEARGVRRSLRNELPRAPCVRRSGPSLIEHNAASEQCDPGAAT